MTPTTEVQSVTLVEVDYARVCAFEDEDDYTAIAVELLIEVGCHVCIAASILPPPPHCWNRHEAVVVGHLARLYKLISAMLNQTC